MLDDIECTEQEEVYAQYRAAGFSKTKAAQKAYDTQNPRQMGYEAEKRERVARRIAELKEERAESAGLDVDEQIRRYNDLYLRALEKGQLATAKQMLERIDAIGGFDAPTKSISVKGSLEEATKVLKGDDLEKDIKKFQNVLSKHTDKKEDTVH